MNEAVENKSARQREDADPKSNTAHFIVQKYEYECQFKNIEILT